jgi:two-component sensor histidine kinase
LSTEVAMPLSLIVNELVTNAVKHGMANGTGEIVVNLTEHKGDFSLSVEDPGEGFDLAAVRRTSSGLQLVSGLARQIHGKVEATRHPSRVCLNFPSDAAL